MKQAILYTFDFNLGYAQRLTGDIPADRACVLPLPGMNHMPLSFAPQ
ncbi:MAG: hypothetical protein HC837_19160 [Chloroflexaceae bacterium]|nr:hypothetical protein [Chloroflexaceae bacterium]